MKFILTIFLLIFCNFQSIAQWKTYYPESKSSKEEQVKVDYEKSKKNFENHLFSALKYKTLEDFDESLNYLEKCKKINPKNALPFYESALIYYNKELYDIAIEQIELAIGINDKNRWYLLLYADILFRNQDFAGAAKQYTKLIFIEPNNQALYFKLADTYIYSNNIRKAIKVYEELQLAVGFDKMLCMQKHRLFREINDVKGAINELLSVLNVLPNDIETIEILSELYILNDEKDKAFELFKRLSTISPNSGRIHLTLSDYYRDNKENEKSYYHLKLAFNSPELNLDTKIRILISYYQLVSINKNMQSQAYELADILKKTHPNNLKVMSAVADILYADGNYQEAKEHYLFVIEKDKSIRQIWSQVLFIQADQIDIDGMLKTSQDALDYFPSEALFYYFNGIANKHFKNYDESIKKLQIGIDFVIENPSLLLEFYSTLADIYHYTGQYESSDEYYEKALAIDSNNVLILNNYSYYLSLRKTNLLKAKEMSFRCNTIAPQNGTYQDTYAWVLYNLEEYEKAKEWLKKALINGGSTSAVVVEHYGDVLYKLGEVKEAIQQWNKAQSLGDASKFLNQKIEEGILYE